MGNTVATRVALRAGRYEQFFSLFSFHAGACTGFIFLLDLLHVASQFLRLSCNWFLLRWWVCTLNVDFSRLPKMCVPCRCFKETRCRIKTLFVVYICRKIVFEGKIRNCKTDVEYQMPKLCREIVFARNISTAKPCVAPNSHLVETNLRENSM